MEVLFTSILLLWIYVTVGTVSNDDPEPLVQGTAGAGSTLSPPGVTRYE